MKLSRPSGIKTLLLTVVLTGFISALVSCSRSFEVGSPQKYRIPWQDESTGLYDLREVELKTFSNPERFKGDVATIWVEPAERSGRVEGERPVGRFIRGSDGVMVPADYVSLLATSVYAHYEKLFELDSEIGAAVYSKWPATVGVQTLTRDRGRAVTNNAIYDGRFDALLIVPYSERALPIGMNAGILGHEHFHSIFQKTVLNALRTQETVIGKPGACALLAANEMIAHDHSAHDHVHKDREELAYNTETGEPTGPRQFEIAQAAEAIPKDIYNSFLLRGLNEGLADFWGWVYTGDDSFVGRSLPYEQRARRLDANAGQLLNEEKVRTNLVDLRTSDKIIDQERRISQSYDFGTQYARFLRELAVEMSSGEKPTRETRIELAKIVLKAMPLLTQTSVQSYSTSYMSPDVFLKSVVANLPSLTPGICTRLRRFVPEAAGFETAKACAGIESLPGPEGFIEIAPSPSPSPSPTPVGSPDPSPSPSPSSVAAEGEAT